MTDAELLTAEREARVKAWNAPKSVSGAESNAWARLGTEWCELHREALRRGLTPSTADASFRPQSQDAES